MRKPFHSSSALRAYCLFFFAALSFLSGCGRLRSWYDSRNEPKNPHSVTITWIASTSPVAGYNVYRESQTGGYVKLTLQIVPGTQYTDKYVEGGQTYSYYVTSVDPSGVESKPSAKITVTVPTTAAPTAE